MLNTVQSSESGPILNVTDFFATSLDHLLAELERIDLMLQTQVRRARQMHVGDAEFQGLCIGEEEVDALLAQPSGLPRWAAANAATQEAPVLAALAQLKVAISQRKATAVSRGIRLRLDELARLFKLDELDLDLLLVCLAPEMDLRYEKLYAYLQDDVTKKRPSVDLVLNLVSAGFREKIECRGRFASGSPLVDHDLIQLFIDPSQPEPTLLRKYCKVDDRIVSFLLGRDGLDERLRPSTTVIHPEVRFETLFMAEPLKQRLMNMAGMLKESRQRTTFYFQGSSGTGKKSIAEALCREVGLGLLVVQVKQLLENPNPGFEAGVQLVMREALLQDAAVYWQGIDPLFNEDKAYSLHCLLRQLEATPCLGFIAGETVWEPAAGQLRDTAFIRVQFPGPSDSERLALWERSLMPKQRAADVNLTILNERFRLGSGNIQAAVKTAQNLAQWRNPREWQVTMDDLYKACRLQSNRKLTALARKIDPKYALDDIVLPPDPLAQLKEMIDQAKHRSIVYGAWGFDRKLSLGKGLCALFSGPPGTGKTMAAEVIAKELDLDLYKIDLSQIVNKYIGETEKNLDQIFREAHGSNTILFFDEADALFGKRSETKDAHDRYANIEVGYLLQKMEEYEGIAILATNLRQNMDEAFVRRLHVIVEFPFPDEEYRRRLWQVAFPREAPIGEDVNFGLLAREVRLPGGNIKNIALAAAFYAASDGKVVRMPHLVQAARREHQKLGRTWNEAEGSLKRKPLS